MDFSLEANDFSKQSLQFISSHNFLLAQYGHQLLAALILFKLLYNKCLSIKNLQQKINYRNYKEKLLLVILNLIIREKDKEKDRPSP